MSVISNLTNTVILEKTTPKITATVQDEDGEDIPDANLDTLTLTLYSMTGAADIINDRSFQDVLNVNNVTVDSSGNLIWLVQELDTIILNDRQTTEDHRAVFEWTYNSGTKNGKHVIDMRITNLKKIT